MNLKTKMKWTNLDIIHNLAYFDSRQYKVEDMAKT